MKVLWFVNAPFTGDEIGQHITGGRGGWLSNLAGIVRDDMDLTVVCAFPRKDGPITAGKITTHFIYPKNWKLQLLIRSITNTQMFEEFNVEQLLHIVEKVKPDIIHIHGTEKGYIELLEHQPNLDIPILVSMQGIMTTYERLFPGGYDRDFLRRFWYDLGGRRASLLPKRYLPAWGVAAKQGLRERKYLKYARYIDGRTAYDRQVSRVLAPSSNYYHIDRVLRNAFSSSKWIGPSEGHVVLHTTMSDSLGKGFDIIANTANHLSPLIKNFRWQIAGLTAKSNCVKAARKKLGRNFPEEAFDFLGNLTSAEITDRISRSSVFVLTSYCENSPNALAEAQVVGAPCISTAVGGVPTYLRHEEDGLLVPLGDPLALAGAILELVNDPKQALVYAESGRRRALDRHCTSKIKQQVLETYRQVLLDFEARR